MSIVLNGHTYDASQFYGYGYLQTIPATGLTLFPNSIFTDMLAELAASSAVLSGGISPSTSGNILVSNGTLWTRSRDGTVDVVLGGHLLALADATKDIGASGASRFRDLYLSRNIVAGDMATISKSVAGTFVAAFLKNAHASTLNDEVSLLFGNNLGSTIGTVEGGVHYRNVNAGTGKGELRFSVYDGGSTRYTMAFAGNVGNIGTGSIQRNWNSGYYALEIGRPTGSSYNGWMFRDASDVYFFNNAYDDGVSSKYASTGPATIMVWDGASYAIATAPSGTAGNAVTFTNRLVVAPAAVTVGTTLLASTDATYDIGASGANRFRDLLLSRSIVAGGPHTLGTGTWPTVTVGTGNRVAIVSSSEDGILIMANMTAGVAATRGSRIYLGARGSTGVDNFTYGLVEGIRESAVSGTMNSALRFWTNNAAGTEQLALTIDSAKTATFTGSITAGTGGLTVVTQPLKWDQTGTRSWQAVAAGGNLAFTAGDNAGKFTFNTNIFSSVNSGIVAAAFQGPQNGTQVVEVINTDGSGDNKLVNWYTDAGPTLRGSIDYNRAGGLIRYNTTSDYRAKEVFGPFMRSGEIIDAVDVHLGRMLGATMKRPMFIAHEVQPHAGWAVSGEKDGPELQHLDHSSLVPILWAEVRALRGRVAGVEKQLAA